MVMPVSRVCRLHAARHIGIRSSCLASLTAWVFPRPDAIQPAGRFRLGGCLCRFGMNAESGVGRIRKCLMGLRKHRTVRGGAVHPLSNAGGKTYPALTWCRLSKMEGVRGRGPT